jgi:hypothetical protein
MLYPTRQAVLEIVQCLGYRAVVLQPKFANYLGAEDYETGERRSFVCAKKSALANLAAEIETINIRTGRKVVMTSKIPKSKCRRTGCFLRLTNKSHGAVIGKSDQASLPNQIIS